MIPTDRFERQLPMALTDLAAPRTPDYLTDILGRTARTRQRPAWASIERWLPMELVTARVPVTRLPMRQLGVLALIAILLAAALAVFIGTRPPRVPPPFGVAGNGQIAYASDGDIFASDESGTAPRRLTSGPEDDSDPLYSPDGRRVAFLRRVLPVGFDLMVTPIDEGEQIAVSNSPLSAVDVFEWAPDSSWLLVSTTDKRLIRVDALKPDQPTVIATDAILYPFASAFRPPDGHQIMFVRASVGGLWALDLEGAGPSRLLIDNPEPENRDFRYARWSPDGATLAFPATVGDGEQYRIHVANADGTGIRRVSNTDGIYVEQDLRWSPDGSRISFNRWRKDPSTAEWTVQPIGVITVASGEVVGAGPVGSPDGTLFEWSPDGASLIGVPGALASHGSPVTGHATVIDATTGEATELSWNVQTNPSWQRVAP